MQKTNEIWPMIIGSASVLIIAGLFVLLMLYIFNKRQLRFKLEKKLMEVQHQQMLLRSQLEIQEQTLENISAEIHDNIIQLLSLSKLNMNSILQMENTSAIETARETKEILSEAINSLRTLSHHLNGNFIMSKGLYQSILSAFQAIKGNASFRATVSITGTEYDLGGKREIVLFRIFQEAMQNCMKHAGATNFSVALNYTPRALIMQISDDGNGFDITQAEKGIGLQNIKTRAALINAKFELQSHPGKGTHIRLIINKNDGKPGAN